MTKSELKQKIVELYNEKSKILNTQDLAELFDKINISTGINVFSIINKGKRNNTNDINSYATGSGGRTMMQYKSGHVV